MTRIEYVTEKQHSGKFCKRCGDKVRINARRCQHCGHTSFEEVLYFPTHEEAQSYMRREQTT